MTSREEGEWKQSHLGFILFPDAVAGREGRIIISGETLDPCARPCTVPLSSHLPTV